MSTRIRRVATFAVAVVAALVLAGPAQAAGAPRIRDVECIQACHSGQPRGGSLLLVTGTGLGDVYRAVFPGGVDGIRDLRGRAGQASTSSVRVRVPWEATTGRFILGTRGGMVSEGHRITLAPVPVVSRWSCIRNCAPAHKVKGGSLVLVRGARLAAVRKAVLNGGPGTADDLRARVSSQSFSSFRMRVPGNAVTGPFTAREARQKSPARTLSVVGATATPVPTGGPGVFPVRGAHTFGGAGARFGSGRAGHTHQGQDVIAACGIPLVAAQSGTVRAAKFQSSAGNYVVIDGAAPDQDTVYMHLREPSTLKAGDPVTAGQPIGVVGETGNAQGCHLHFEIWTAPGWYVGGHPIDPLPQLKAWEAAG